jgi:hypothetical protein
MPPRKQGRQAPPPEESARPLSANEDIAVREELARTPSGADAEERTEELTEELIAELLAAGWGDEPELRTAVAEGARYSRERNSLLFPAEMKTTKPDSPRPTQDKHANPARGRRGAQEYRVTSRRVSRRGGDR